VRPLAIGTIRTVIALFTEIQGTIFMRKFLLATTAAAVVLTLTGRVFAENEPPTATIAPPKAATAEGLLFNKDASEAKPIEAKPATQANPADAKPAETKPTETKPAEQAAAPAAAELGPVAQQIRDIVEGKFSQYVPREQDRVGVTAFYKARNYAPLWVADGKETPRAQQAADFLGKVAADGLNPEDYPVPQFGNTDPAKAAASELALTHSILNYARHASLGRVAFSRVSGAVYYDQKAQTSRCVSGSDQACRDRQRRQGARFVRAATQLLQGAESRTCGGAGQSILRN